MFIFFFYHFLIQIQQGWFSGSVSTAEVQKDKWTIFHFSQATVPMAFLIILVKAHYHRKSSQT